MDIILSVLKKFYPENCVETLLVDLDILNLECLKIVASKTVGYAIIVASVLIKVGLFFTKVSKSSALMKTQFL